MRRKHNKSNNFDQMLKKFLKESNKTKRQIIKRNSEKLLEVKKPKKVKKGDKTDDKED